MKGWDRSSAGSQRNACLRACCEEVTVVVNPCSIPMELKDASYEQIMQKVATVDVGVDSASVT